MVFAVTCLGVTGSLPSLGGRIFDLVIIDEASQILQSVGLASLFLAHRFVLVGDSQQLPPIVKSSQASLVALRLPPNLVTYRLSKFYFEYYYFTIVFTLTSTEYSSILNYFDTVSRYKIYHTMLPHQYLETYYRISIDYTYELSYNLRILFLCTLA